MENFSRIFLLIIISYLLGSLPISYLLGRIKGIDLRKHGSGNVGATNAFRVLGPGWGIAASIGDIGKGVVAVSLIPSWLGRGVPHPEILKIVSGIMAVCGHNWTVFLRFKGGKGVATSAGVFLGLAPRSLGLSALVWFFVVLATGYVSVGSITASLSLPVFMGIFNEPPVYIFLSAFTAFLIIFRHRPNIRRLIKGEENRFNFQFRGKDKRNPRKKGENT